MICEKCGQNVAVVHCVTTEDETGKRIDRRLCEACYGAVPSISDELPPSALTGKSEPLSDEEIIETFKKHVPELAQGDVEIRFWAREPGVRSLMAVFSPTGKCDPLFAMLGSYRGERTRAIMKEIHEFISLVLWCEKAEDFIHNTTRHLSADPHVPAPVITFDPTCREACMRVDQKTFELHHKEQGELLNRLVRLAGWELKIEMEPPPLLVGE